MFRLTVISGAVLKIIPAQLNDPSTCAEEGKTVLYRTNVLLVIGK